MSQPNQWGAADRSFGAQTYGNNSPALIAGRFIDQMSEIRAQDIPTNGIPALFPMNDQSMIVAKFWDANAEIKTVIFRRDDSAIVEQAIAPQQPVIQKPKDPLELILSKLDNFDQRIRTIEEKQSGAGSYYGTENKDQKQEA